MSCLRLLPCRLQRPLKFRRPRRVKVLPWRHRAAAPHRQQHRIRSLRNPILLRRKPRARRRELLRARLRVSCRVFSGGPGSTTAPGTTTGTPGSGTSGTGNGTPGVTTGATGVSSNTSSGGGSRSGFGAARTNGHLDTSTTWSPFRPRPPAQIVAAADRAGSSHHFYCRGSDNNRRNGDRSDYGDRGTSLTTTLAAGQ